MNEPRTPEEWQVAVDGAHAVAMIEAARLLGFIAGGPTVNLQRCSDILAEGERRGFTADPLATYEYLRQSGAPVELQAAISKIEEMAEGGLLAAALIDTPMRDYAITHFYRGEA